jgi:hypothetical protein
VDAERFGEAELEWLPPGPGTYGLEVVALDAAGGRGTSARVTIIVADASLLSYGTPTPAPANVPSIVITGITCGPKYTVKVDFEVSSPSGVISVEIYSAYTAAGRNERTYMAPYPLTVKDTLWVDEERPDFLDRPHQFVVVAQLVGQPNEVAASPYEPGPKQRCPGHFEGDQQLAATLSTQALWIARLNTNCRIGPGTAFDSQDVIESGAQAPIDGQNAEGTWFRVQPPGSSRTCWVSTASGDVQGDLSAVPVIAVALIATTTASPAPANQPPVIQDFIATPSLILTDGTGCPAYSRTVTLSAVISDDAGLESVVAQWSLGSLSGEATLLLSGGGTYSGAIGPVSQVGTMSIDLIARDTSGALAQAGPRTVNVQNCIE